MKDARCESFLPDDDDESGDVKGTIRGIVQCPKVSNNVRRLSRQRPRVRVPSSPPFKFKDLPEVLSFLVGTKRHKMGTSWCPAYSPSWSF